jgi:TRAP-type C4-dicarboxylate transport system substrate-binding protein
MEGTKMKHKKIATLVIGFFVVIALSLFTIGTAASQTKPIELKVATWNPPHIPPSQVVKEWAKVIEERSGGKVKFTFYFASSLCKMEDTFRATQTGLADVGSWVIGTVSGLTPLNEYISLPFLGFKDAPTVLKVFKEMQNTPELAAEFKNMKYLYGFTMPSYHIHTTKKEVRVPEHLRGMKVLADANATAFPNALGAVSVVKGPPDWYISLQKGLVEGMINHWNVVAHFKLEELMKYHTQMGPAGINSLFLGWWMNEDTWEKLPPEAQKAIMDVQEEFEQKSFNIGQEQEKQSMAAAREAGHPIIELTPEELEQWAAVAEKVNQKWVDDLEAKGKPAKAIYKKAKKLIKKFNK